MNEAVKTPAYEPLKEGLAKLAGKPKPGPTYKRNPKDKIEASAIAELCRRHGRPYVSKRIGVSVSHLSDIISSGSASKHYELAARYVLSREADQKEASSMTRDQCLEGLARYYSRLSVFDLTAEDQALLSRTLGDALRARVAGAGAAGKGAEG